MLNIPFFGLRTWAKRGWTYLTDPKSRRHTRVGPIHLWRVLRDVQISFLKEKGLQPHHHLIDIGCGTLRGGIPIIEYLDLGHYFGIDATEEFIKEAKKEVILAKLSHKQPTLLYGELGETTLNRNFDFIWAYLVLIHMNDDILTSCFEFVERHLSKEGTFFTTVNIGERKEGKTDWEGFPLVWRPLGFYEDVAASVNLHVEDIGSLYKFGHPIKREFQRMLKVRRS